LRFRGLKGNHNTAREPPGFKDPSNEISILKSNGIAQGIATHEVNGTSGNGLYYPVKPISDQNGFATHQTSELPRLFVWSAHEQAGLDRICRSYAEHLRNKAKISVEDSLMERLSYTLNCRRSILPWKSFCIASSINELCNSLEERISKPTRSSVAPKLAFVFTGQGAQWYAMGRELLSHEIFRISLQEADAYLKSLGCPWSLLGKFL
jgi:acyl transferase domain-containing protein